MPNLFLYLIKLSISLSIAWLFYRFVLRGLTFYRLNRWYLLGYTLLSFFIPFIDIGPIATDSDQLHQPVYIQLIPVVGNYTPPAAANHASNSSLSPWTLAGFVLAIGMALLLIQTALRMYSLVRLKTQARLLTNDAGVRIYQVDRPITPFSFGNAIFINPRLHTEKEWEEIILHEYVHIRQRHTLDILLAEAVCILNWYNPFAWALRFSVRQNLEFIADQQVLNNGMDKKEYQYHLLTVMGHPRYRLANNFNFSSLKRRIIMMNKIRSARLHLLRFLFLLPLLAVILLAFRGRYPKPGRHNGPVFVNAAGIVIGLPEKTPLAGVTVQVTGTPLQAVTDANGYYKLRIPVTTDSIRIHLDYTKRGFEPGSSERFWPTLRGTTGIVDVEGLTSTAPHKQEFFFIAPGFHRQPVDPSYPDAAAELQRVLAENRQMRHQKEVLAEHPDIGMFYVTEDKKRRLVIHTDGTTERYGYPGTPSLATMDRNYGTLPWMTPDGANTNRGYLDRWASISAQAERQFHPTGGNPRAIIFPGDSRVIAVDASGKVQVYDMDNTIDPKERSRFERLYGKLPPCVPDKGSVVPVITHNEQDTTKPVAVITGPTTGSRSIHRLDTANVLYIVNGEIMPPGFNYNTIPAADIVSMDVLKGDQGIRLFGEKGVNGVVAFTTKASFQQRTKPVSVQLKYPYVAQPLYVVDGIFSALGDSALRRLNPSQIESITVLKDSAGIARYGDWGRNGVILITTKKGRFGIGK